jgi:multiple sugar transport system permease protein
MGMAHMDRINKRDIMKRKRLSRSERRKRTFFALISPWLIGFVLLTVFPLAFGFLISLTNYDGLNLFNLNFVGFRNYANAFQDPNVRHSFNRTLVWTALNLPIWLILSLLLAVIANQKVKGIGTALVLSSFHHPSGGLVGRGRSSWKTTAGNAILPLQPGTAVATI